MSNLILKILNSKLSYFIAGIVVFGLFVGGLRKCSPIPLQRNVIERDSVYYNITEKDSTWVVWDTAYYSVSLPSPTKTVLANTPKKTDKAQGANRAKSTSVCDSIRYYTGVVPINNGSIFYSIEALGKVNKIDLRPQLGVQNRLKIKTIEHYKEKSTVINNTPFITLYAGIETNPMAFSKSSLWTDLQFKKYVMGYRYELNTITPHHIKLGVRIWKL